jgi:hypothetical protein
VDLTSFLPVAFAGDLIDFAGVTDLEGVADLTLAAWTIFSTFVGSFSSSSSSSISLCFRLMGAGFETAFSDDVPSSPSRSSQVRAYNSQKSK